MVHYLATAAGVQAGETIVLVDLGYAGTVQSKVQGALEADLSIDVMGAYLLLRDTHISRRDKLGWLDGRGSDARSVRTLANQFSTIEQLCTCDLNSVIDYSEVGEPIRRASQVRSKQSVLRDSIQSAALHFVDIALASEDAHAINDSRDLRDIGAALLGRFLFFPTLEELDTLNGVEHDVNLGTDFKVRLFEPKLARAELRRHGFMYINGSERLALPMEMRAQGIHMPLTMFTQERFGLDFRPKDFSATRQTLSVMVARGNDISLQNVPLDATYDGYLTANIGVGACELDLGLIFGKRWSWIQLESVNLVPVEGFSSGDREGISLMNSLSFEHVKRRGETLIECLDDAALMLIQVIGRNRVQTGKRQVCVVVFRPIEEQLEIKSETQAIVESAEAPVMNSRAAG